MKFFVEKAESNAIQAVCDLGLCGGVILDGVVEAATLARLGPLASQVGGPVFFPAGGTDGASVLASARLVTRGSDRVVASIPIGVLALEVSSNCYDEGIAVNITGCRTASQALLAGSVSATYVTVEMGAFEAPRPRRDEPGNDGAEILEDVMAIFEAYEFETLVIASKITHPDQVAAAALAGVHGAVVSVDLLMSLL